MQLSLIDASRNALAELCGLYNDDVFLDYNDGDGPKKTLVELYESLTRIGENVTDYRREYEMCKEDLMEGAEKLRQLKERLNG